MATKNKRLIAVLTVAAMTLGSAAAASATTDTAATPATENLFISAGCPSDTPGTCTSTRWLGKTAGDATSNFLTATTPVDEVLYRADGSLNWRDYPGDDSLRADGYALRADAPITATVAVTANGVAIEDTVHAYVEGTNAAGDLVTFGPLEQKVTLLPAEKKDVKFSFDIPAELEGVAVSGLAFYVALHGVNAQGGYINQAGGSSVQIPYWVPATATP